MTWAGYYVVEAQTDSLDLVNKYTSRSNKKISKINFLDKGEQTTHISDDI